MLSYIVGFLAVALFPLALAGYGGYLATMALTDEKQRRRAKSIVWVLAGLGVLFAGLQQIEAYRSDKEHNVNQGSLQAKLDTSLQQQQHASGQLEAIALMIGAFGNRNTDLKPLADAITNLARASQPKPPYILKIVDQTEVKIPASVHGHGPNATVTVFDNSIPPQQVLAAIRRDADGNLIVNFAPPFSGTIQIN